MFKKITGFPNHKINREGVIIGPSGKYISAFIRDKRIGEKSYFAVALRNYPEPQKIKYLHRLLAKAFIPNPEGHPIVNHLDGDKQNNSIDNLEWCTHSRNLKHAYDNGYNVARVGAYSHAAKLTPPEVLQIRGLLLDRQYSKNEIAEMFGVSRGCILGIHTGKTWRNL